MEEAVAKLESGRLLTCPALYLVDLLQLLVHVDPGEEALDVVLGAGLQPLAGERRPVCVSVLLLPRRVRVDGLVAELGRHLVDVCGRVLDLPRYRDLTTLHLGDVNINGKDLN